MLRDYQVKDLAFHLSQPKTLNLSDPGTGKTPTVCVYAFFHWSRHQRKTVWSMPKSLMKKNRKEMIKFTDFGEDDVVILESDFAPLTKKWVKEGRPTKVRMKKVKRQKIGKDGQPLNGPDGKPRYERVDEPEEVKDLIADAANAKVFICTYKFLANHWQELLDKVPDIDVFLVDELHMGYAGVESAQTESFYWVNSRVRHFIGMTGTIIDGRLDTAFPAIHAIEPRYYGSYGGFLDHHSAFLDERGRTVAWKGEDKLRSILDRHAIRHTFEEVYGEEPVVFFTEYVDLAPSQRAQYDLFHEQAMLELDDGRILDGTLPGVSLIRARQIMGHPETMGLLDAGETTGKDERLAIYAAERQPMLVFASLVPEQERCVRILRDAGLNVALINNSTPLKQRGLIDEAFQSGQLDAIVGSGPTVAVGYNWERADHVVFISVDYKDTNVLQAYRRASRGTRTKPLRVTFVKYEDTIEDRIYQIIEAKSQLANRVDPTRRVLNTG